MSLPNLKKMNKGELRKLSEEVDLDLPPKATKAMIIDMLETFYDQLNTRKLEASSGHGEEPLPPASVRIQRIREASGG